MQHRAWRANRKGINLMGKSSEGKKKSCRIRYQLAQNREISFCLWAGLEKRETSIIITGMALVVITYDEGLNESILQTRKGFSGKSCVFKEKVIPSGIALVNK